MRESIRKVREEKERTEQNVRNHKTQREGSAEPARGQKQEMYL